jgi:ubiquitin carboxyl-terminal hydrolase L3
MPIPVRVINGKKTFTVLGKPLSSPWPILLLNPTDSEAENNPEVMNALALKLGLSPSLQFHDIYSLTEPSLLALIPRPVHALLVILPLTPTWHANRVAEDKEKEADGGYSKGEGEGWGGVVWFKQTIGHACGSIGLLHCAINGAARHNITPGSTFAEIREAALPLGMEERAKMLYDNMAFEEAHQSVAEMGDTAAPSAEVCFFPT